MDPKNAPFHCPCGKDLWSKDDFWAHVDDCPDAKEFFKMYKKLQRVYVDPEEFI